MTKQEKFDELMLQIRDTNLYLAELTKRGDIQGLNMYRIYLNEKIMEAVKLKKNMKNEFKR